MTDKKNYCTQEGKCGLLYSKTHWNRCSEFTQDLRCCHIQCLHKVGNMCARYLAQKSIEKLMQQINAARAASEKEVDE